MSGEEVLRAYVEAVRAVAFVLFADDVVEHASGRLGDENPSTSGRLTAVSG